MNQRFLPITRNLLIINVICFLLQKVFELYHIDLSNLLGLHFVLADSFAPWQLVSYIFLHGSLTHLFFNMFSLWMFGSIIERTLGAKHFLIYYFVCGIGAGICQELWQTGQYFIEGLYAYDMVNTGMGALMPMASYLDLWTTIGASGACYGVLLAFGMLYPNERIMMLIPPIPMKAKYFVAGYAAIELISAYASNDNVAHFAHLGGMLFGWLLLRHWMRKSRQQRQAAGGWAAWGAPAAPARKPSFLTRCKNWLSGLTGRSAKRSPSVGNAHHTAYRPESDYEYNERQKREEARMDEILDKVRRSGYSSLSREEKEELFRISRRN